MFSTYLSNLNGYMKVMLNNLFSLDESIHAAHDIDVDKYIHAVCSILLHKNIQVD